jgi:HlyD family secretion protein
MVQTQVITEQEYEQAALEHANARAQLVRAQAALEIARERLAQATVRAPIDGTIIEKNAEAGQVISSPTRDVGGGTLLLRMADLTQVQVRTLVDETDIGKIQAELPAEIHVEAFPDRTFGGRVLKVEPQAVVQQNVTMFPVIVRIGNPERLLKPGMTAQVNFLVARRPDVLAVPNQAVHTTDGAATVAELALGVPLETFEQILAAARPANGEGEPANGQTVAADGRPGEGMTQAQRDSLRARFRRGDLSPEEMRQMRERFAGSAGAAGRRAATSRAAERDAVVFVMREGRPTPVPVRIGLTDWDYTEILSGLAEGDTVALLPSASLLREQSDLQQRFQRFRQGVPGMRRTDGS